MFETDLHAHSLFSGCGLHSIIEMLSKAREKGILAQAITDHGPFLGRKTSSTFFERLDKPVEGILLLKGMECNVVDETGRIDVIEKFMKWYDIILLGFHNFRHKDASTDYYSDIMIEAVQSNPCVDIIVHPNAPHYLMNFKKIADAAARYDVAVELNNAKLNLGRSSEKETRELIRACMDSGCMVAVDTDAHALNEVGNHGAIERLLKKEGFPEENIVNRTLDATLSWIQSRKARRADHYGF